MSVSLFDAGVWIAARDPDDRFHQDARELLNSDRRVAALDLTLYESANVAVRRWRSRTEARKLIDLILTAAGTDLVRVDPPLIEAASALGAKRGLTVYDAAYVVAAERTGAILVSTDLQDLVRPGFAISPADAGGED